MGKLFLRDALAAMNVSLSQRCVTRLRDRSSRFCRSRHSARRAGVSALLRSLRGRLGQHWAGLGLRTLLLLSLLFASGPFAAESWTTVLAATTRPDCQQMMTMSASAATVSATPMVHLGKACPACADHSATQHRHGQQPCGSPGSSCDGTCHLLCSMAWSLGLPTTLLVPGRFASGTALIVAVATRVPATAAPTALRPPISA